MSRVTLPSRVHAGTTSLCVASAVRTTSFKNSRRITSRTTAPGDGKHDRGDEGVLPEDDRRRLYFTAWRRRSQNTAGRDAEALPSQSDVAFDHDGGERPHNPPTRPHAFPRSSSSGIVSAREFLHCTYFLIRQATRLIRRHARQATSPKHPRTHFLGGPPRPRVAKKYCKPWKTSRPRKPKNAKVELSTHEDCLVEPEA